jgi:hypothetical protein
MGNVIAFLMIFFAGAGLSWTIRRAMDADRLRREVERERRAGR